MYVAQLDKNSSMKELPIAFRGGAEGSGDAFTRSTKP
jgi:hypothetical protein